MTKKQFYFTLQGRISREQYWLYVVLPIGLPWVAFNVYMGMHYPSESSLLRLVFSAFIFWIAICTMGKRWHDRNKSAWWILILCIPFIGGLWFLIEGGFLKGTDGLNRFGDDPAN